MTQFLPLNEHNASKGYPTTANDDAPGIASRLSGAGNDRPGAVLSRLASLPYSEFAAAVALSLETLGYRDVRFTLLKKQLGKNRDGGIDLVAAPPDGGGKKDRLRRTAVVQLRQFRPGETVQQRAVDEARGACLRAGAVETLLVTTGRFSLLARQNALHSQRSGVAPVYLLDGEALASAYQVALSGAARRPAGKSEDGVRRDRASAATDAARTASRPPRPEAASTSTWHGRGNRGSGRCRSGVRSCLVPGSAAIVVSVRVSAWPEWRRSGRE